MVGNGQCRTELHKRGRGQVLRQRISCEDEVAQWDQEHSVVGPLFGGEASDGELYPRKRSRHPDERGYPVMFMTDWFRAGESEFPKSRRTRVDSCGTGQSAIGSRIVL